MVKMSRVDVDEAGIPQSPVITESIVSESKVGNYTVETLKSGAKRIHLEKLSATFRSPTTKEAIDASRVGGDSSAQQDRLLAIACCTQWGDQIRADLNSLTELRAREHLAVSQILAGFFLEEIDIEMEEGDDYSLTLRFPGGFSCKFRDAKATDIDFIQSAVKEGNGQISLEAIVKIAVRLCVDWNGKAATSEMEVGKRPVYELVKIGKVISENFL
jgi:hypothetical protein